MTKYHADALKIARALEKSYPQTGDDSQDALIYTALALQSLERLTNRGADLTHKGRPLAVPLLERAYRELLYIRTRLPHDWLNTEVLSKFGRLSK